MNVVQLDKLSFKSSSIYPSPLPPKKRQTNLPNISKHLFDKAHIFQILEIHNGRCQTNKGKKQNEHLRVAELFTGTGDSIRAQHQKASLFYNEDMEFHYELYGCFQK